jgi:hypothetical protein
MLIHSLYQLALYSYFIAAFHFGTEILFYKTALGGAISPVIVSSTCHPPTHNSRLTISYEHYMDAQTESTLCPVGSKP